MWEVHRQDVFRDAAPPRGAGWEPFAATTRVVYTYDEDGEATNEVVWWRRKTPAKQREKGGG